MQHTKSQAMLFVKAVAMSLATKASALLKISYIIGSRAAFFSASSVVVPLSGAFGGVALSVSACLLGILFSYFSGHFSLFALGAFHIPGLCAALYLSNKRVWVRAVLPLACMALFMAHPVGGQAFLYSFYWIIPVAVHLTRTKHFWWNALGSTFVAHAVGSTIWLYTVPMVPAVWMGLIPVVALERFAYATGMFVVYHLVDKVVAVMRQIPVVRRLVTAA